MKTQNIRLLVLPIFVAFIACTSGNENSEQEQNPSEETEETIDLTGSWAEYNTKLESFHGIYQDYDMAAGNQVYHFTEDTLYIISDNLELILQAEYKIEKGYLYYTGSSSDEEFNVKKEIKLKGDKLDLVEAPLTTGAITFQFERTEIDLEQLEFLKDHIIDWDKCTGTWVFADHELPSEERGAFDDPIPNLSFTPLDILNITASDSNCFFIKDTLYYSQPTDTTTWIFLFEHHYANEGEPRKLLLSTIKPKEQNNQILEYHKN